PSPQTNPKNVSPKQLQGCPISRWCWRDVGLPQCLARNSAVDPHLANFSEIWGTQSSWVCLLIFVGLYISCWVCRPFFGALHIFLPGSVHPGVLGLSTSQLPNFLGFFPPKNKIARIFQDPTGRY